MMKEDVVRSLRVLWKVVIIHVGPLPVVNEVIGPLQVDYTWVTGVITSISGVITPLTTARGPHLVPICVCSAHIAKKEQHWPPSIQFGVF